MKHSFDTKTTGFTSHPAATPQLADIALPILLILVSFFTSVFSAQGQITQAVTSSQASTC
ncbi:hypothetical protein [Spirosoma pollinicola]|nr:hypothetical protein [Spirosoma pollinicola]